MSLSLSARLAAVDARIAAAAADAGRDPGEITRIVVTKFHPATLVRELYQLGVRAVGENRQQELTEKRGELAELAALQWHFIGQAQTNKAKRIRAATDVVHSVDRIAIAEALDRAAPSPDSTLDILLQVNLTDDPARGGVTPAALIPLAEQVAALSTLRIRGVMAVAPLEQAPLAAFTRLAASAADLRTVVPDASWISAGMSHDFADAIACGATHLRIGAAITGPRPARG